MGKEKRKPGRGGQAGDREDKSREPGREGAGEEGGDYRSEQCSGDERGAEREMGVLGIKEEKDGRGWTASEHRGTADGQGRLRELGGLVVHTSPVILLQSRGERIRVWIRARLPACCRERDSWSAYIFPPQSR